MKFEKPKYSLTNSFLFTMIRWSGQVTYIQYGHCLQQQKKCFWNFCAVSSTTFLCLSFGERCLPFRQAYTGSRVTRFLRFHTLYLILYIYLRGFFLFLCLPPGIAPLCPDQRLGLCSPHQWGGSNCQRFGAYLFRFVRSFCNNGIVSSLC